MPAVEGQAVVCGNPYPVQFDLDAEWDGLPQKTARFRYRRNGLTVYEDVPFSGTGCIMPAVRQSDLVEIGLCAGDLRTTTPARIPCLMCVTDPAAQPAPERDVFYDAVLEMLRKEVRNA